MNKTVVFDIDDTICNLRTPLSKLLNEKYKVDINWREWKTYHLTDLYNTSYKEITKFIIDSDILRKAFLHPNAMSMLEKLYKKYDLVFISSRDYHPEAYSLTKKWMDEKGIPYHDIYISGKNKKSSFIRNRDVILRIDDYTGNIEDFKNNGVKNSILMTMPWNKSYNYPRINNLEQVLKIV